MFGGFSSWYYMFNLSKRFEQEKKTESVDAIAVRSK